MKNRFYRTVCAALCLTPLLATAQTNEGSPTPHRLYEEGRTLFRQKAYAAAVTPLRAFISRADEAATDWPDTEAVLEAEYMLVCAEYELRHPHSTDLIMAYIERHPDAPQTNRLYALAASNCFFAKDYEQALHWFDSSDLEHLAADERNEMTYRMAVCYLETGNTNEAAVWFEVVRAISDRHQADCTYYLAYIAYTQGRYDDALPGLLELQNDDCYRTLVPYYIAECYLGKGLYDQAETVARTYLTNYPQAADAGEMERVVGTARYHAADYLAAMKAFDRYAEAVPEDNIRRDARYMQGLSCYRCGVYTRVPGLLADVTKTDDALGQNAWLHIGLADLKLGEKHQARMAFEQAAASDADPAVKEQAAYNHALCIHDTDYSAFGESVDVFERFLNTYPNSAYADRVSSYLVEVYMNTRSYDAALKSIDRIAQPGRTILEAKQKILFRLGTQAFANTQFAQAVDDFDRSIALGQYDRQTKADALYWRGEACYRQGRMNQAERDYTAYLSTTTDRSNEMYDLAHYNLGYIAFNRRDYATARRYFLTFVQHPSPTNKNLLTDACNRIGDCFLDERAFDSARQYYTLAEQQGTAGSDYSYYQLALVAGLQKDYDGKTRLIDQLTAKYPDSPYVVEGLYEKGRAFVQSNQSAQAIATYQDLLQKYPESPVSRKAAAEIGLLYYQNRDYDRAIEAYKHVATQYPGSAEARMALRDLKSLYVETNRVDEFAALAQEMPGTFRFEPSEQDSLTYIAAEKVFMKGDTNAAKTSLERYLQTFPQGAYTLNAHHYLCNIAQTEQDDDAILAHAGKLLEYPDSPYYEEALVMHATVLFNRQQFAEAMTDYQRLQAKATDNSRRQLAATGVLRCAVMLNDDTAIIHAATTLLAEPKLTPELRNEALYDRAKAYLRQQAGDKATADLTQLAADTRTLYGAEAKYLLAQQLYDKADYQAAEKELLDFIEQSTPHAYWLARGFVLLADVYVAMDKKLEARQYLLSLQQNYQADDDIATMIEQRLEKLKED